MLIHLPCAAFCNLGDKTLNTSLRLGCKLGYSFLNCKNLMKRKN